METSDAGSPEASSQQPQQRRADHGWGCCELASGLPASEVSRILLLLLLRRRRLKRFFCSMLLLMVSQKRPNRHTVISRGLHGVTLPHRVGSKGLWVDGHPHPTLGREHHKGFRSSPARRVQAPRGRAQARRRWPVAAAEREVLWCTAERDTPALLRRASEKPAAAAGAPAGRQEGADSPGVGTQRGRNVKAQVCQRPGAA